MRDVNVTRDHPHGNDMTPVGGVGAKPRRAHLPPHDPAASRTTPLPPTSTHHQTGRHDMSQRWGTGRTGTTAWRRTRQQALTRDEHRCLIRYPDICTQVAETVDHIEPHYLGGTDDLANLQSACWPCHRRKTGREAAAARPTRKRPPTKHPGLLP